MRDDYVRRLTREALQRGYSRRQIIRRAAALGLSLPAVSFILAACGGEDDEETPVAGGAVTVAPGGAASPAASGSPAGTAPAAAQTDATPAPVGSGEAGDVLVRTPGGAYEEAWRKAAWEPFAQETGIRVVPVATNAAKILAMVESGNVDLDVLDLGEFQTIILQQRDALERLDTSKFTLTNLDDVDPVHEFYTGNNVFATVIGYNTEAFPDAHPTSWAEFWDVESFPGARMLEDMAAGSVNLEFALLADGVSVDDLYPIDMDRAFDKLAEIRDEITKWWDSGAVSAQMLADKQVVLGSVWNGRIQTLIDQGAPLAIEWNQAERLLQGFSILKGAPNLENAYKLIDYSLQPEAQARFAKNIGYGPVNSKAFDHIDEATMEKLPTSPDHLKITYANNAEWWVENQQEVAERWQEFLLGG